MMTAFRYGLAVIGIATITIGMIAFTYHGNMWLTFASLLSGMLVLSVSLYWEKM